MKLKKYLIASMALLMVGTLSACSSKPAEKKEATKTEEKKDVKEENKEEVMEKASDAEKEDTIKALEEQKALELAIPTNKESDNESIENRYNTLITKVKEDKMSKEDVVKLGASAKKYIENVKMSKEESNK